MRNLLFDFNSVQFVTLLAVVFATPIAVSAIPMVQEMSGDVDLAGQLVVWTTFVSTFTMFSFIFVLRLIGVF